jgi:hypothetical protein
MMRLLHGFGLRGKLTRWRWCNFRQRPFPANVRVADHTASEHRFGFEGFASTGLNTA